MNIYKIESSDSNNAAVYSFIAVYGRIPMTGFLPLNNYNETDEWNNITKDKHLDNNWIAKLNSIKNIEILSTCEGHGRDVITHIIFRITDNTKEIEQVYNRLKECYRELYGTKVVVIDTQIGLCICVAIYNWYRENDEYNKAWIAWWNNIPSHIDRAVNN